MATETKDLIPLETMADIEKAAQCAVLLADILNRLPRLHPCLPLLPRAYAISSAARIGVYDCLYVSLAEREGCQLVTADTKLVANLQAQFPFIVLLAAMP